MIDGSLIMSQAQQTPSASSLFQNDNPWREKTSRPRCSIEWAN